MDGAGERTRGGDMDSRSIEECARLGGEGQIGDALNPVPVGDEDVVTFNLILHHLVGPSEAATRELQVRALSAWRGRARRVFVDEYIYQSFVPGVSGRLIYEITSSKILSFIGRSEGHTSELQSLMRSSYAVFCLKNKKRIQ